MVLFTITYVAGCVFLIDEVIIDLYILLKYYYNFTYVTIVISLLFFCFYILNKFLYIKNYEFHRLTYITTDIYQNYLRIDKFCGALAVMLLLPAFFSAYTVYKSSLLNVVPYSLDKFFIEIDLSLHGGRHPWVWMSPLLNKPAVTKFLDSFYFSGWLATWTGICVWMAWSRERILRERFIISFLLTWSLLGTGLAYLLSSSGPCFLRQTGGDFYPYTQLFDYLYKLPMENRLTALNGQEMLWSVHESRIIQPGCGISAMPSMHLAMMTLCTACAWKGHKLFGIAVGMATTIIFIASIALGWHYAIDGYVAIILTGVIWWGVGLLQKLGFTDVSGYKYTQKISE